MIVVFKNFLLVRKLIKENRNISHTGSSFVPHNYQNVYPRERLHKSFNKSIIVLRIAIKKLGSIIETVEDDWVFYDILLQHRNILNRQIDLLIKQKKKISEKFLRHTREDWYILFLIFRRRKIVILVF